MNILRILFLIGLLSFFTSIQSSVAFAETATESATVQYDLAYPGILPDHSLYFIKKLRDKMTEQFTTNIEKKATFYILQADKGILASAMLVDKKKIDLAKETALKAENNITLLSFALKDSEKKLDSKTVDKLKKASLKHQEVLRALIKRVPSKDQEVFKNVLYFSEANLKSITTWQNKKQEKKNSKVNNL